MSTFAPESSEPASGSDSCVVVSSQTKTMSVQSCSEAFPFLCYRDNLVLLEEKMSWDQALEACGNISSKHRDKDGTLYRGRSVERTKDPRHTGAQSLRSPQSPTKALKHTEPLSEVMSNKTTQTTRNALTTSQHNLLVPPDPTWSHLIPPGPSGTTWSHLIPPGTTWYHPVSPGLTCRCGL
ncbi:hypothetical protein WMY93_012836 [Mugilogobius chulae]|uniref:Uncharacterized protein n=1 Tax=Mugilogobius chulae TaxID=88201 RepID=A0AAW0P225_9GOBI